MYINLIGWRDLLMTINDHISMLWQLHVNYSWLCNFIYDNCLRRNVNCYFIRRMQWQTVSCQNASYILIYQTPASRKTLKALKFKQRNCSIKLLIKNTLDRAREKSKSVKRNHTMPNRIGWHFCKSFWHLL